MQMIPSKADMFLHDSLSNSLKRHLMNTFRLRSKNTRSLQAAHKSQKGKTHKSKKTKHQLNLSRFRPSTRCKSTALSSKHTRPRCTVHMHSLLMKLGIFPHHKLNTRSPPRPSRHQYHSSHNLMKRLRQRSTNKYPRDN